MTDFDALIDNFEKSRDAMYETVTAQEREEVKERHKQSRSALREAIAEVVIKLTERNETVEQLTKEKHEVTILGKDVS